MTNEEAARVLRIMASGIELKRYTEIWISGFKEAYETAIKVLEERPQGKWKLVEKDNQDIDVVCPFCNRPRFLAYSHGYTIEELEEHLIRQHLPKFCESCGAKMKGGAE